MHVWLCCGVDCVCGVNYDYYYDVGVLMLMLLMMNVVCDGLVCGFVVCDGWVICVLLCIMMNCDVNVI